MFLLLAACTAVDDDAPIGPGDPAEDSATALPGDTAADTGADTGDAPKDEFGCAAIYGADVLPAYDLQISDLEWARLEADYSSGRKDYHEATLVYAGEPVPVMVRLKGNPNFSWFGEKLQMVISFNEVDPDARWHGLRKIALDASWYDASVLRDRISWDVMRTAGGLPAACANNATLSVNGEFYGVYGHLEYFDHEYLERAFGKENAGGGLWKYGAEATANGDAADAATVAAFWAADTVAEMEAVGDVSQWVRAWAAETVLGDDDGYVCCAHNFYLYEHPEAGVIFVPWDFDDTLEITAYDVDPIEGYAQDYGLYQQSHYRTVLADPGYRAAYVAAVGELNAAMDPARLLPEIERWDAQIAEAAAADTMATWGDQERAQMVVRIGDWVTNRHAFVDAWAACAAGSTEDADGDGLTVCEDHDDHTPVGPEACNDRDDDGDGAVDEDAGCDDCVRHDLDHRHRLYCSTPRTATEAQAACEAQGGELATLTDTEDVYMSFFWAWPDRQVWWLAGGDRGSCYGWDEVTFSLTTAPCTEAHPSICTLP